MGVKTTTKPHNQVAPGDRLYWSPNRSWLVSAVEPYRGSLECLQGAVIAETSDGYTVTLEPGSVEVLA